MPNDFYHKCPIKNLSPERPSDLLPIEEQLLFTKIAAAMKRRGWKMHWLEIDLENKNFNIDHPSITKEQTIAFYTEVFSGISKEILDHDEAGKKVLEELATEAEDKDV